MDAVLIELANLRLDLLDEGWVQAAHYSEFLEFGELSSEYENASETSDVCSIFKKLIKTFNDWLHTDNDDEKSWAILSHQVKHQNLLALLAYYIDFGGKNVNTKEHRNNALLASRVYYKLLLVPGYKAYHIYHSQLFAHSLACLGFPKVMCDNEDNYYNTKELTREVNSVIKELSYFVNELKSIMVPLQLSPSDMNFEDILSNLVDITGGAIVNKLNVDKIELANISRVIYEMIDILICDSDRQPNVGAIQLLFKCLLPKLVAASVDSRNSNNLVRASYVTYSGLLLSKYGKAALTGYIILLQHLCYTLDGLERAEVRCARVSLVVGLMSLLPRKSYRKIVKWLLKLTATSKIPHRQIAMSRLNSNAVTPAAVVPFLSACLSGEHNINDQCLYLIFQEMLSNLLSNDPDEKSPNTEEIKPKTPEKDTTKSTEENTVEKVPDETSLNQNDENQSDKVTISTDDENSQELPPQEDITEEDIAGLLRQRPHTVPYSDILRAVYERVNDVSSTLRTRALAILTDCLSSDRDPMRNALKELNGEGEVGRLMAAGARCVCDERAAVRRAAVPLVHRLITARDAPEPNSKDLTILVSLCRDASILVRSAAIGCLGELVQQRPAASVFDAFLAGPLHQLSDPETKVQEQVVTLVQQLVIDRLQKYSVNNADDLIPWQFLDGVTRHNMRRHLQKACTILVKTSTCISHRLVDILSTQLGAVNDERDLQCLVMLTSVARYVDYSDIGFVLDYYYKLTEDVQVVRENRLMPLTLELMGVWSRWVQGTERSTLRDHLVRHLAHEEDDGCRISRAALAAQLDPDNLTWATELMQLSERSAAAGGVFNVGEWVRAADLSLVAPQPPQSALLTQFLTALADIPPEWTPKQLGCAVAAVGRLCMRSREAAGAAAPRLAALLADARAPLPARINALLALTDICTRYTCIVEPLLGTVCGCLAKGGSAEGSVAPLRRAAARALTRLLLAGYLRLRTPLYYRYCALLADEDDNVREPAEYYVSCCLTTDAIYHHFVDCILHYNKNDNSESISFDARQLIYDVMLQRMSLVQKLNIQCRLARDVMAHAAELLEDGDDELPLPLNAALLDTITLLCGPRMKLPKKPQNNGDAADMDDLQERVTTNIVSHKMKRTVAEEVVPAVLRLYAKIRVRGGQLATYLVRIATDLLNDYRHEIEELIENDEELVGKVRQFQETIGLEPSFGNARNLVTTSAPPEPVTPRAPRKRPARSVTRSPRKRALRM